MTRAPSDAGMDHIPEAGKLVERVARALVALHSPLLASDEYWPRMVRDYLEMCKAHPDYADGRSTITDAFRNARAAIEATDEVAEALDRVPGGWGRGAWQVGIDAALRDGEG